MLMVAIIVSKNLEKSDNVPNAAITTIVFPARVMWTWTADFSIQVHGALLGGKRTFAFKTSTWNEYVFGWMSHSTYVISLYPQAK